MKIFLILIGLNLLSYLDIVRAADNSKPEEETVEKTRILLGRTRIADEAASPAIITLLPVQVSIQAFFEHEYDRDLVTRFVKACPKVTVLAEVIGRCQLQFKRAPNFRVKVHHFDDSSRKNLHNNSNIKLINY
jgi:hypothetical protein